MLCECGNETETRAGVLDIGFIHGCWSGEHMEFMDLEGTEVYDLFPITGDEKETEDEAIKSYKEWTK